MTKPKPAKEGDKFVVHGVVVRRDDYPQGLGLERLSGSPHEVRAYAAAYYKPHECCFVKFEVEVTQNFGALGADNVKQVGK